MSKTKQTQTACVEPPEIDLVPDASDAARRAVDLVAARVALRTMISPMPTPVGALWLELCSYRRLDQVQLRTVLQGAEENDRRYRELIRGTRELIARCRDVPAKNHWGRDGHLVAGAPPAQAAAVRSLERALLAMPPAPSLPAGQRRDPLRAQFADLVLALHGQGMHYGHPETYWLDGGDYRGSLAELVHSAPTDFTRPPYTEDDLGEHYDDAARLYDFLRGCVRDARRRHGLKAR